MKIFRILLVNILWIVMGLLLLNNAIAEETMSSLVKLEEYSIADDIVKHGAGDRLVIPGVDISSGGKSSVTIKDYGKGVWSLAVEFDTDQISVTNSRQDIFGNGSIHRYNGKVKYNNDNLPEFIGEGDINNRLTFILLKDVGLVYVRGDGKVVFPGGRTVVLGDKSK